MAEEIKKRKLGIMDKAAEVEVAPEQEEPTMDIGSFIAVKGYSISILHRIEIFLKGETADRTQAEWEEVYSHTMNRITG